MMIYRARYKTLGDVCWLLGTLYLESWKRSQAMIDYKWNVSNFEAEEVSQLLFDLRAA